MRFYVLLSILALAACANNPSNKCGNKFVIPMYSSDQGVQFKEILLPTLNSPYKLKGAAAEIFHEGTLTNSGYSGSVAQPRFTQSGDTCVPMDTGSALSVAAYAHFEKIFYFDRELAVASQVSWPRKVGIELHLRSPDGMTHNNAHYFGTSDSIGILPYSLPGQPLVINGGVIAHEHFHAHFQSQVLNPLNTGFEMVSSLIERFFYQTFAIKPQVEDLDNADLQSPQGLNRFVLRSWNEGIADFYGAVFSGEADFFSPSLPTLSAFRELTGPITLFRSGDTLVNQRGDLVEHRRTLVGTSYQQGTLLARLLYRIGVASGSPKAVLRHIMPRLKRIPTMAQPMLAQRVMNFDAVVPVLLEGLTLNAQACEAIRMTVSKPTLQRTFRQCGI